MELNEITFKDEIVKHEKAIVLFYREQGCSHCEKFKPIFEEYAALGAVACFTYKLGNAPDSIATPDLVKKFPTIVATVKGQIVNVLTGVLTHEQLDDIFNVQVDVMKVPMSELILAEAGLLDKIYPLKVQLKSIQAEMEKRRNV